MYIKFTKYNKHVETKFRILSKQQNLDVEDMLMRLIKEFNRNQLKNDKNKYNK